MMRRYILLYLMLTTILFTACREEQISSDPSMQLAFSKQEVLFDTVFTGMGSSTQQVMIYNRNRNAIRISDVWLENGNASYFKLNLDGENKMENLHNIVLNGKDSLFLFIRVTIDPQKENSPVLVTDTIRFLVNGNVQNIALEAYGQNVRIIRNPDGSGRTNYDTHTFINRLPYLIYDTVVVGGPLYFEPGATLYMHNKASIYALGDVQAMGEKDNPITIRGDRLDHLFDSVPYAVASGQWGGVFLINYADNNYQPAYTLRNIDILSGSIGLYCYSESPEHMGTLQLENARIHNHSIYGVVLQNTDATIANSEISNCAAYCLYLEGGKHTIAHTTVASFFGWPYSNLNIHNTSRQDVAAVYINNLSKEYAPTELHLLNSIVTGARDNNLVVATPLPKYYEGEITGSYLKADSIKTDWCHDNVYASDSDTVFVNTYYLYREYKYYDFRLDSVSPARGIGDSIAGSKYPFDKVGRERKSRPDAGCYEY